ncbi:unnamed protein product [Allacma fusca]|uniref:Uncharacterized protein n=1 Tax=Allacma fusca TaxID=39272 RepID=A0A8J2MBJ7_9HEXA|nr:unnamed protein product [Allacma fusca]
MRKTLLAKYFTRDVNKVCIPTSDSDVDDFTETSTLLGLDNIIRPPVFQEDVPEIVKNCVTPRQDAVAAWV